MASAIFYGGTEARAGPSDKIEFEDGGVLDAGGYVVNSRCKITRSDTRIPATDYLPLNSYDEYGIADVTYTITGIIRESSSAVNTITNLRNFCQRRNITTALPNGAFGIRIEKFKGVFDVTPNASRGLVIIDMEMASPAEDPSLIGFIITMGMVGGRAAEGASLFG